MRPLGAGQLARLGGANSTMCGTTRNDFATAAGSETPHLRVVAWALARCDHPVTHPSVCVRCAGVCGRWAAPRAEAAGWLGTHESGRFLALLAPFHNRCVLHPFFSGLLSSKQASPLVMEENKKTAGKKASNSTERPQWPESQRGKKNWPQHGLRFTEGKTETGHRGKLSWTVSFGRPGECWLAWDAVFCWSD